MHANDQFEHDQLKNQVILNGQFKHKTLSKLMGQQYFVKNEQHNKTISWRLSVVLAYTRGTNHLFLSVWLCVIKHTKTTTHKRSTLNSSHFVRKTIKATDLKKKNNVHLWRQILNWKWFYVNLDVCLRDLHFLLIIRLLYFCHHLIIYIMILLEYIGGATHSKAHTLAIDFGIFNLQKKSFHKYEKPLEPNENISSGSITLIDLFAHVFVLVSMKIVYGKWRLR